MNLKRGASSQRAVPVEGWNLQTQEWEPCIALGTIHANDLYISGTDYSLKKRIFACSHNDRIEERFKLVRVAGIVYIVESENQNDWKNKAYQYVYQFRRADLTAELYRMVSTEQASGALGQPVRTLVATSRCDLAGAGVLGSSEVESLDYSRMTLYLPGDIAIDGDVEVDIPEGLLTNPTLDVISVQRFNLMTQVTTIRRGVPA